MDMGGGVIEGVEPREGEGVGIQGGWEGGRMDGNGYGYDGFCGWGDQVVAIRAMQRGNMNLSMR